MSDLPYPDEPDRTHWDGCYRSPKHHNCAVKEVDMLRAQLATAREALRDIARSSSMGRDQMQSRALAPALDRVIAEVEANHYRQFVISENFFITRAQNGALAISGASMAILLRALRNSADETGDG